MSATIDPLAPMKAWVDSHQSEWLEEFTTFLKFPSISAEPEHEPSLLACLDWLTNYVKTLGFHTEIWQTQGHHPTLFASNLSAGKDKPTLLIYNHYDVQPIDPIEEWTSPPFTPAIKDGNVYARGAQDNKGQCFYVLQALKLLLSLHGTLPINIKLCIEGEEEIGSAGLSSLLKLKGNELSADYLAIVDLGIRKSHIPALTLGIRGIVTLDVKVQGAKSDLHSGSHGGIAPNPLHAIVKLLSTLRDENGKITIPGFYDSVKDMPQHERSQVSFAFDPKEYYEQTGTEATGGETNYPVLERAWIRPTLEINGIQGGYNGQGFKTIIPKEASAKISCRLVPGQQPQIIGKQVAEYLEKNAPPGTHVTVTVHKGQGEAVRVSPDSKVVQAFSKAFQEVFQTPCEFIYEGASIPIVSKLSTTCHAETILLGLGLTTDNIHAPNEHFSIDRIKQGILSIARAIQLL